MITKIVTDNLLDRRDIIAEVTKALNGSWGKTVEDNIIHTYNGNNLITYIYSGRVIKNVSENYSGIASIVYEDDSFEMRVVPKSSEITTTKTIKLATLVALLR